jgi:Family of unknown function (DUF6535)
MSEIIAALPLLLYCSVILFFGGLALWMWKVHNIVGLVVVGGGRLSGSILWYIDVPRRDVRLGSVSNPTQPIGLFIHSPFPLSLRPSV